MQRTVRPGVDPMEAGRRRRRGKEKARRGEGREREGEECGEVVVVVDDGLVGIDAWWWIGACVRACVRA